MVCRWSEGISAMADWISRGEIKVSRSRLCSVLTHQEFLHLYHLARWLRCRNSWSPESLTWICRGEIKISMVKEVFTKVLQVEETVVEGFEKTPEAFMGLFTGDNTGKMVVKV